jgi:hypothetical protein
MRSVFIALSVLGLLGCSQGLKAPVGAIAPWILDQSEFEAIRFDVFNLKPKRAASTVAIGNHPVGTNILARRKFIGSEAKAVLRLLERSESRPFHRKPVELGNSQDCILRFVKEGHRADVAIDPDALIIVLYIDGKLKSFRTYQEPDPELKKALSPFLEINYPESQPE